jgi:hypothetical protein
VPRASAKPRGLGRAATFAFGAAVAASTTIACGDDSTPGPVDSGPGTRDSGTAMMDAGGGGDDGGTSTMDSGTTTMDSGTSMTDSGTSMQDAGFDAGEGMVMPLYGAPPMPE